MNPFGKKISLNSSGRARRSIRTKMFFLFGGVSAAVVVAVSLIGLFGLPWLGIDGGYQHALETAGNSLNLMADLKKDRLSSWIRERRGDIEQVAEEESFRETIAVFRNHVRLSIPKTGGLKTAVAGAQELPEYSDVLSRFESLIEANLAIKAVYLIDVESERIMLSTDFSDVGQPVKKERLISERHLFPLNSWISRTWLDDDVSGSISINGKIYPPGNGSSDVRPLGILAARVSVASFIQSALISDEWLGQTGEIIVVDSERRIFTPLDSLRLNGAGENVVSHSTAVSLAAMGKEGILFTKDYGGRSVLAAYRYLPINSAAGWGMVIKKDLSEIMKPFWHRTLVSFGVGILGLLIVLAGVAFFSRQITKPLQSLHHAAAAIQQGDLATRSPVIGTDEVSTVAEMFNEMVDSVASWHKDLEKEVRIKTEELREEIETRKKSEDALKQVQSVAKMGGWKYTAGQGVMWSDEACRILGVERNTAAQSFEGLKKLIHPDDLDACNSILVNIAREVEFDFEFRMPRSDGSVVWIAGQGKTETGAGGRPKSAYGFIQDISERKEMELSVIEREERYRALVESSSEHHFMLNSKGEYISSNDRVSQLGFVKGDDLSGKSITDILPKETIDIYQVKLNQVIRTGQAVTFEHQLTDQSGRVAYHIDTLYPIKQQSGKLWGVGGISKDVSELRRSQERFQQTQKIEAIGRLAGGIAHDFNNMLSIIIGYAELALCEVKQGEPLYHEMRQILEAGRRSKEITSHLLAFARKQTIAPEVVRINDVIENSIKMLSRLIGEDIRLNFYPAADIWNIKMDRSQLEQILANLAVNSRDAIRESGDIVIETANVTFDDVYCSTRKDFSPGPYVMLSFSDSGIGMDKRTMDLIFEPFFTTKEPGKGTGLGLSTVFGAVKQNNGSINVYSEAGKGTTFKIYFPRFTGIDGKKVEDPQVESLTGTETILVAEDEAEILALIKLALERLGYNVLAEKEPKAAIALSEAYEGKIHLLLTDVVMPEMNGKELVKRIVSDRPGIKFIYMSGYTANVIADRGVLTEGVNYIQKPFSGKTLAMRVRQVLDG